MLALACFLIANTAYLVLVRIGETARWDWLTGGPRALPLIFQGMVLAHTGIGILLSSVTLVFVAVHLPSVWGRRHRLSIASGVTALLLLCGLLLTGLFIVTAAASSQHRWAWWSHVLAGVLVPAAYVGHRLVSASRPRRGALRRYGLAVAGLAVLMTLGHSVTARPPMTPGTREAVSLGLPEGPGGVARDVAADLGEGFLPGLVPPRSPFFPSPATTSSGARVPVSLLVPERDGLDLVAIRDEVQEQGFVAATWIGARQCERCHADVAAQWATSAHRFSSFNNPFYEATVESVRAQHGSGDEWMRQHLDAFGLSAGSVGHQRSQWCGACHDPALLFTGQMSVPIDRESPAAQAGLTCMACHGIGSFHDRTGNGNYNLEDLGSDPYLFARAEDGIRAFLHDAALKAKPAVHRRRLLQPYFKEPEFCLSCHKVSLSRPINGYRWLRGQDEYDGWHDSGVARNASRTFYLPTRRRTCQDCHMPPEPALLGDLAADSGTVRSHRFTAANTALPFLRGDTASIRRIEAFLRDERLSVDLFALRRLSTDETVMDLGEEGVDVAPGERVRVDVVVRNRGVGHTFPGGTIDSNEGWLELSLLDVDGAVLTRSGDLQPDGSLDPLAHAYKAVLLDSAGAPIHDRNGGRIHVTAAVNVIRPGTSDVAHYVFRVPESLDGDSLRIRARLLWRKFDRAYTRFAFEENPEGFVAHDSVPDLPITEIAADEVRLRVTDRPADRRSAGSEWQDFNDYGIALLLRGSTAEARAAFQVVADDPAGGFEGHLNLARVSLNEGNLTSAFEHLDRAETRTSGDARAAWVWASALQEEGRYADAADAYRYVLESFSDDRAAWRNLGRVLFLAQRHEEALEAFDAVLAIDPEDRVSHYHRMLSLRFLGREKEAAQAEAAYERFRVDESAQSLAGSFRARNPGVNLMYQAVHTHELVLPGS